MDMDVKRVGLENVNKNVEKPERQKKYNVYI